MESDFAPLPKEAIEEEQKNKKREEGKKEEALAQA
jgi:hypothetical protein